MRCKMKTIVLLSLFLSCVSPNEPEFSNVSIQLVSYKQNTNTSGTVTITVSGTTNTGYSIYFSTQSKSQTSTSFFSSKNTAIKIRFNIDTSENPDILYIEAKNDLEEPLINSYNFQYQYQ